MGLRAVCRTKEVTPDAVGSCLLKAAKHVHEVTIYLERAMHLTQCQIDEFWSYILKKPGSATTKANERTWAIDGRLSTSCLAVGGFIRCIMGNGPRKRQSNLSRRSKRTVMVKPRCFSVM